MSKLLNRAVVVGVLLALTLSLASAGVTAAQDDAPVACDSTLAVLLLVAEHDYDYVSGKMDMGEPMPKLDLGQYQPVMDDIVSMMMQMMEEGTPDASMDMTAHDEMLQKYMDMDSAAAVADFMQSMNMTMSDTTQLTPGDVAGEDPVCSQARADVEKFLLAHILTDMSMDSSM